MGGTLEWTVLDPSLLIRHARRAARVCRAPRQYFLRRRAARASGAFEARTVPVDPSLGYRLCGPGELPGLEDLVAQGLDRLAARRPHLARLRAALDPKFAWALELTSDAEHARAPELLEFALQPDVLAPVIEYLGTVPFLARVALPLSAPLETDTPIPFHSFHVDNDDLRVLKLFVNLTDVEDEDGPLCFLPADTSARVLRALRRGAPDRWSFTDEEVWQHADPGQLVRLTGPAGTAALIDLARCLHFGSRLSPGRERLVFAATYLPYHRLQENPSSQLPPPRADDDLIRRLLLQPPTRHPVGTFYPERA